jgi:copper(I)-binding protein
MDRSARRRELIKAGLAIGLGAMSSAPRACEVLLPNLRLVHPWTRATRAGSNVAIVCMAIEDVTESDRLIGVRTPVAAGATLGGVATGVDLPLDIPAGRPTLLGEDGPHIVLTGLRFALHAGRAFPLLVMFEKGGIASISLTVDFPAFA